MSYTTKGKAQDYMAVDIDNSLNSSVDDFITGIENWIERYCGKAFEIDSATERFFDGNGLRSIVIDPFVDTSITAIVIINSEGNTVNTLTEGQGNDFIAYPLNDTEKTELVLISGSTISRFPSRSRAIKITAKWGHSVTVPKQIELVATKLLVSILSKGIDGGKLSKAKLGELDLTYEKIDEEAEALGIYNILDMYRDLSV